jgi:hypothetical protein
LDRGRPPVDEIRPREESQLEAVVLEEIRRIVVREVADAEIRETTDVLPYYLYRHLRTDIHFYEGHMHGIKGGIIDHEPRCAPNFNITAAFVVMAVSFRITGSPTPVQQL